MSKLINLTGAEVTFNETIDINSLKNIIGTSNFYINFIHFYDDEFYNCLYLNKYNGYDALRGIDENGDTKVFYSLYFTSSAWPGGQSFTSARQFVFTGGDGVTNSDFIEFVLNNGTVKGGIYGEETSSSKYEIVYDGVVLATISTGEKKTLKCSGKKMKSDVIVRKVEEEEEVKIGTINYNQTSAWLSIPIHRSFEIGMTWEEFINSDYNKVQNDTSGSITISGQFILSGNYVKFYGKETDEPYYKTLDVLSSSGSSISKTAVIQDGYNYSSSRPGSGSN